MLGENWSLRLLHGLHYFTHSEGLFVDIAAGDFLPHISVSIAASR